MFLFDFIYFLVKTNLFKLNFFQFFFTLWDFVKLPAASSLTAAVDAVRGTIKTLFSQQQKKLKNHLTKDKQDN